MRMSMSMRRLFPSFSFNEATAPMKTAATGARCFNEAAAFYCGQHGHIGQHAKGIPPPSMRPLLRTTQPLQRAFDIALSLQ